MHTTPTISIWIWLGVGRVARDDIVDSNNVARTSFAACQRCRDDLEQDGFLFGLVELEPCVPFGSRAKSATILRADLRAIERCRRL
jgi:hypothetical protein